ncbi:MAG: hypothetical protein ACT4OZ_15730 [Gemmatimonadota bacterium]
MSSGTDRFREVFNRVERHIEIRYGLPVVLSDVPDPFTGDLDGASVVVDWQLDAEDALFILIHLFGHTVQWNLNPAARELGLREISPSDVTGALLEDVERYEIEAARYSLQLFRDSGIDGLDQWLADFAACDVAYLLDFYRTGAKRPFRAYWRDGSPLLDPLAIPHFRPTKWVTRSGTVI